eukprot:TRINITY_DN1460_c0_g1_i1.p1 TRINITY_DN1460_c0_g1~~TRINITY_DN1460_c0_g1_i1.p1  ORF type:complete len:1300 (+),score=429.10 TRINITY_DN1460_c0_g1_i1:78-3977(+)
MAAKAAAAGNVSAAAGAVVPAAAANAPGGQGDDRAVTLAHRHVFGLRSSVKGNIHFTEDTQVLYPAGHNTILYLTDQRVQSRVFPGTESGEGITCLAVSPSRKFLAVCERVQDRATCSIFDVHTGKRRRGTLTYADCEAHEYVCAAFSAESKFLITQGGAPDWTLVLWSWDKARPHGAVKVSNQTGSVIHECSFNPEDSSVVCVIGDGVFKFFRLQEGSFKTIPNQLSKLRESTNQNYVCHAWLHDDRLVICSESGDCLLFDSGGEFKMVLPCSPGEMRSLLCVTAFSKGFVTGGDNGTIRVFERHDDPKEMFKQQKVVVLNSNNIGAQGNNTTNQGPVRSVGAVTSLAVSPSEEVLAIATSNSQLLQLGLSQSDLLKTEDSGVDHILTSFHSGPILGLDVCVRKPLVVTCGIDKSVRIWNYVEKTQELCKFFSEEAYSVAFHPSGFHLIVGFSDKLRLMNLLMEDMRPYKEIPIKACRECRFSHGGQFFAAVNSNTIQIYKTYTCEVKWNLRGHQSKVRSVCWTADDSRIVSTGADGAAYEYDIIKERRVSDWAQKGTSFSCVIAYTDPATQTNTMYVVGSDKMLKEVQDTKLTNYLESNAALGQLALASGARALFAGVAEPEVPGPLRCYNFPLDGDYAEYQAHSAPVSRIRITYDDLYLFSAGDDGCLCIFDVKKKVSLKRDKDGALGFADEILVTRAFLDDKQAAQLDLERQVEELTSKIEFQLRHKDRHHKEKMAELQEKYGEEIETERRKFEVLREEKAEMEMEYEDNIRNLEETHAKQTQELEQSFQQKMLVEVQRYQKLAHDLEREKQEWEAQHGALVQEQEAVIQQMREDFERQQRSNGDERDRIIREKVEAFTQHQETLAQLEQDADHEIEQLKEMYEQKLAQEKDEKIRLRGQAGIHRKHHDDLRRQMQKKQDDVCKEGQKNRKAEEKIMTLLKDKESNEKEIKERDKTIADKEQRIYALRNQNQELEKFKFVLDYKIKELKAQIDPKSEGIQSMKTQIQAMNAELDDYKRKNKQLALDISQLQMKQRALQEEIKSQKRRLRVDLALIQRFKLDLSDCMEYISEPKQLKESVVALYWKYVQTGVKKLDLDTDMQKEYNRQRDYLEKSVDSLKRKLEKDSQAHRIDNMRIMQENVSLIREINDLRREINALKHERTAQEMLALSQRQGDGSPAGGPSVDATVMPRGTSPPDGRTPSNIGAAAAAAALRSPAGEAAGDATTMPARAVGSPPAGDGPLAAATAGATAPLPPPGGGASPESPAAGVMSPGSPAEHPGAASPSDGEAPPADGA